MFRDYLTVMNKNEKQNLEGSNMKMGTLTNEDLNENFPNSNINCESFHEKTQTDCHDAEDKCFTTEDNCEKGINDIVKLMNSLKLDSGGRRPQLTDEQRKEIVAGMQKIKEEVCEKESGDGIMKAYMSAINDLVDEVKHLLDIVNKLITDTEMTDESIRAHVSKILDELGVFLNLFRNNA